MLTRLSFLSLQDCARAATFGVAKLLELQPPVDGIQNVRSVSKARLTEYDALKFVQNSEALQ